MIDVLFTMWGMTFGAISIGNAITQYKKEHYYWCGLHIMCAVVAITLLVQMLCI